MGQRNNVMVKDPQAAWGMRYVRSDERDRLLAERARAGASMAEMADEFCLAHSTLTVLLRRLLTKDERARLFPVDRNPAQRVRDAEFKRIWQEYPWMTMDEIARIFDVTRARAQQIIHGFGDADEVRVGRLARRDEIVRSLREQVRANHP